MIIEGWVLALRQANYIVVLAEARQTSISSIFTCITPTIPNNNNKTPNI
jgi:hypothetical protein